MIVICQAQWIFTSENLSYLTLPLYVHFHHQYPGFHCPGNISTGTTLSSLTLFFLTQRTEQRCQATLHFSSCWVPYFLPCLLPKLHCLNLCMVFSQHIFFLHRKNSSFLQLSNLLIFSLVATNSNHKKITIFFLRILCAMCFIINISNPALIIFWKCSKKTYKVEALLFNTFGKYCIILSV